MGPKGSAGHEITQVWIQIKDSPVDTLLLLYFLLLGPHPPHPLSPNPLFALCELITTGKTSQAMPLLYLADLAKFKHAVQWHTMSSRPF